jgi:hypothetical protein
MKVTRTAVTRVVEACLELDIRQATVYISPDLVVRATRRHKPQSGRCAGIHTELVVTLGKPNYLERLFIKACKQSGEPFPVKKIQLRPWPKRCK